MTSEYERECLRRGVPRPNELTPRLLTTTAMTPWPGHIASSRLQMFNGMLAQTITVKGSTPPRIFTGEEPKYGEYTSQIRLEQDTKVIRVITRYPKTMGMGVVSESPQRLAITTHDYKDPDSGRLRNVIDVIDMPYYHSTHTQFGFKYVYHTRVSEDYYGKGTIIATSPSIDPQTGMWKYGIQCDTAAMTIPQIIEDGVLVSVSFCEWATTTCYETHQFSFGKRRFPLNTYGDDDIYKIMPDIGGFVRGDGLLAAFRAYDDDLAPVIMSKPACQRVDYKYDDPIYVKAGARIVDIRVYRSTRNENDVRAHRDGRRDSSRRKVPKTPVGMEDQVDFYFSGMQRFYSDILSSYTAIRKNRGDIDITISRKLHRLLIDAQVAVQDSNNEKLTQIYRGVPIDEWHVEIDIEYDERPGIGSKLTGRHGNKGVIVEIRPDEDMPVDQDGNRAHFVEDIVSMFKRMNPSRDLERYITASARETTKNLRDMNTKGVSYKVMSDYLLGFYEITSPRMIPLVVEDNETSHDIVVRKDHMDSVIRDGIYLWMPTDNDPETPEMVDALQTRYPPVYGPIQYRGMSGDIVTTIDPILIGGSYIMPLEKIGKTMTAVSTSKLSNFGIPTKLTSVDRTAFPLREQSLRFGESEFRLFNGVLGGDNAMEILDRTNNPSVRRVAQHRIQDADEPMAIDNLVDRTKTPRGSSRVVSMIKHFNECAGRRLVRSPLKPDEEV